MSSFRDLGASATPLSTPVAANINIILDMIRSYLGMDVAFLAEFSGAARLFRGVSTATDNPPIRAGDIHPLGAGYCQKVVHRALPELIPDTAEVPLAATIPETASIPIGAHLSVPVRLNDGHVYGTLCCFSHRPRPTLGLADLELLHKLAGLTANMLAADVTAHQQRRRLRKLVEGALSVGDPGIAFQPIIDLCSRSIVGFEALSRFASEPVRSPDKWFADAASAGIGNRLELLAARRAIDESRWLPAGLSININLSPQTILTGDLMPLAALIDPARLVIEITEHTPIDDYAPIEAALKTLRQAGVRIAIDDAGAGYSSLLHVLRLQPDIIKFDTSLTRGIDKDQRRIALVGALVEYSRRTGTAVVAEGVETAEEELVLQGLGVDRGQGYLYGRPKPASAIAEAGLDGSAM
ncbi:EAL domain, c-di-GMP-specific phosphodiesterase class I (or its enzymatically inactive variant) [Rhizobium sp. RU35A]|uniref:sensor domain-containing phosphodiesterase n=1 Tax=Rhizobium sp. RU35A TaxID=1907414 RepID=UPI0009563E6D|nr:EAL domain-containing protein [Rhizobium sp. RU35A]SIQ30577.1 EAL domain, c-di-GMP-specific phosphodiesterase class I (or its enzymatically inactive variant) [Rhizobium sp. RU35A]